MSERRGLIYLTGFSGTGKTSVGRLVADALGWDLFDTDELISQRAGAPIVDIFERGEEVFRKLEREVLEEIGQRNGAVVSTGGGLPADARNRRLMNASGVTVRLDASPETIHMRLKKGSRDSDGDGRGLIRPMIQEEGSEPPVERIRKLLEERERAYTEADATVDTERLTPAEAAEQVVEAWRSHARAGK